MNYIYGELNRDILPKAYGVFYGVYPTIPDELPITAQTCTDSSHLQYEGWCKQKYEVGITDAPKYPYFAYPAEFGTLKHVKVNQIFDIFINWAVKPIIVKGMNYYLYYYKNMLAPGRSVEYLFKTKSEEDAD